MFDRDQLEKIRRRQKEWQAQTANTTERPALYATLSTCP